MLVEGGGRWGTENPPKKTLKQACQGQTALLTYCMLLFSLSVDRGAGLGSFQYRVNSSQERCVIVERLQQEELCASRPDMGKLRPYMAR